MSASSTRRLKDASVGSRPSSGQKLSKDLNPVSISSKKPSLALQKSSSGKENPRPSASYRSGGSTQKPVIRPVPRAEKFALSGSGGGGDGETRIKRSASSGPRGRSSSPSELIRVFADLRREKGFRVSVEMGESGSDKKAGYSNSGVKRVENETDEEIKINTNVNSDPVKAINSEDSIAARTLNSDSKKHCVPGHAYKSAVASNSDGKTEKVGRDVQSASRRKSMDNSGKVVEISKEQLCGKGSSGFTNKYSSKLHEKLAFLEGKVKKISSDIKKTKDILDLNNPDTSKVIISDLQNKISGIESAMSYVGNYVGDKPRTSSNEEKNNNSEAAKSKSSVKGLNREELEDRLFPHQRLLRNRAMAKPLPENSKTHDVPDSIESNREIKVEVKPLDTAEENEIATEFLASLDKENSNDAMRSDQADLKSLEVQETDTEETSKKQDSPKQVKTNFNEILRADEALEEFDDEENGEEVELEDAEDAFMYQLNEIGSKTSTGGWFVSEGEAALLAHDDGSCSYHDIANSEVKSVYKPPNGISPNTWRDCWIIRAAGADGCLGRYVVAASAGNTLESGFCSWDFYTKEIKASHFENGTKRANSRAVLAPLSNNTSYRNTLGWSQEPEAQQWWYRPCGPLVISTASSQRSVMVFDIRDGEQIMKWELQKPVSAIDYSSPLQWRNRGKVVIAEAEAISVWDVNSQHPEAQLTISSSGRKISALHINNTDAELGGGVRQRVSSSEAEGNDGVFCTTDSINILDFRHPSGIGAKIPKLGVNAQSISSRGDSIFLGCTNLRSTVKKELASQVQQFSIRKQRLVSTYVLPESKSHSHHSAITQVWGNSNMVMAISGMGLFVFDSEADDCLMGDYGNFQNVKEIIGPDDMYSPSFDYSSSRALLISRDRPALWRHLL